MRPPHRGRPWRSALLRGPRRGSPAGTLETAACPATSYRGPNRWDHARRTHASHAPDGAVLARRGINPHPRRPAAARKTSSQRKRSAWSEDSTGVFARFSARGCSAACREAQLPPASWHARPAKRQQDFSRIFVAYFAPSVAGARWRHFAPNTSAAAWARFRKILQRTEVWT